MGNEGERGERRREKEGEGKREGEGETETEKGKEERETIGSLDTNKQKGGKVKEK